MVIHLSTSVSCSPVPRGHQSYWVRAPPQCPMFHVITSFIMKDFSSKYSHTGALTVRTQRGTLGDTTQPLIWSEVRPWGKLSNSMTRRPQCGDTQPCARSCDCEQLPEGGRPGSEGAVVTKDTRQGRGKQGCVASNRVDSSSWGHWMTKGRRQLLSGGRTSWPLVPHCV